MTGERWRNTVAHGGARYDEVEPCCRNHRPGGADFELTMPYGASGTAGRARRKTGGMAQLPARFGLVAPSASGPGAKNISRRDRRRHGGSPGKR